MAVVTKFPLATVAALLIAVANPVTLGGVTFIGLSSMDIAFKRKACRSSPKVVTVPPIFPATPVKACSSSTSSPDSLLNSSIGSSSVKSMTVP